MRGTHRQLRSIVAVLGAGLAMSPAALAATGSQPPAAGGPWRAYPLSATATPTPAGAAGAAPAAGRAGSPAPHGRGGPDVTGMLLALFGAVALGAIFVAVRRDAPPPALAAAEERPTMARFVRPAPGADVTVAAVPGATGRGAAAVAARTAAVTCRRGIGEGRFHAVTVHADGRRRTVAVSPAFRLAHRAELEPVEPALGALRALERELRELGWEPDGRGPAWHALQYRARRR
jgi:hypothetical protein